jgi:hypothetical protein
VVELKLSLAVISSFISWATCTQIRAEHCVWVRKLWRINRTHARTHSRTHARTHTRMHTHTGTHARTHAHARTHTHTSLFTHWL